MPNHVTSICTITGSPADVTAFFDRHIIIDVRGDVRGFAFETIIPIRGATLTVSTSPGTGSAWS